jgi:hypothetical protein
MVAANIVLLTANGNNDYLYRFITRQNKDSGGTNLLLSADVFGSLRSVGTPSQVA